MASGPTDERLSIVHVTPHPWESGHAVNDDIGQLATTFAARGHRVAIVAPSDSRTALRESRRLIEATRERPGALFEGAWRGQTVGDGGPRVIAMGSAIPLPRGPKPRIAPLPVDVNRRLESFLAAVELDLVHVHDPFAPSLSSAALRHSRTLMLETGKWYHLAATWGRE